MFKRLGVFGLMLAAATTSLVQPATAFAQDRYDRGYAYHDRDDHRRYDGDRDFYRNREWREREAREHAWREHEWREHEWRERRENRGYYNNYAPGISGGFYYGRPY